jgi:hypothetical protein
MNLQLTLEAKNTFADSFYKEIHGVEREIKKSLKNRDPADGLTLGR